MDPRVINAKRVRSKGRRTWTTTIGLAFVLVLIAVTAAWYYFRSPAAPTVEKANPKQMAMPLPEKPSIAVLPFVNPGEDPKYNLLGDGITDNIINTLSKLPELFVIARNSTLTYKGKPVSIKQVSEELGVRYVLEGSIQASGDRIRITAQLSDALKGVQIWSERYGGAPTDVFNFQDDITTKVVQAVVGKLEGDILSFSVAKFYTGTKGLDCYMKFLEALALINQFDIPNTKKARQILEESSDMCQGIPALYRLLAVVNRWEVQLGISKSPKESLEKAKELFQKALSIDENDPYAPGMLAHLYVQLREYDKAIAEGEKAVTLQPGSAVVNYLYASILNFAGRIQESIPLFEKAIRLNPAGPGLFYFDYGMALLGVGRKEDAIVEFKKAIERAPNYLPPHIFLTAAYAMSGQEQGAHAEAAEVLRIMPNYSVERFVRDSWLKDQERKETIAQALRQAGLPEKPPSAQAQKDSSQN
jgi:adenylate cyclase